MVTIDDVARWATALPDVQVSSRFGNRTWLVGKNGFAWERPLSKADIKRFGAETPPSGDIVAVRLADLGEREAVLAENRRGFFTIEHFAGYPAVLVQLAAVSAKSMREILVDGWLACAPAALTAEYAGAKEVRALTALLRP